MSDQTSVKLTAGPVLAATATQRGSWSGYGFKLLMALCLPLLALGCLRAAAQDQPPVNSPTEPFTLHVKSNLVTLDVVVVDHQGHVNNELTRGDFHVTEDGVAQTVLNFEPPSAHAIPRNDVPITSTAELESRAKYAPVNIFVLDEINTSFQAMAFARYALKKYLNAQSTQPLAPTMLIAASVDKFTVIQDYSQNREAILSSLNHHLTHYPWNLETSESKIKMFALSLGALNQIAQATAGHPGHKNLIWVGRGFPGIDLTSPSLDQNEIAGINSAMQQAVNLLRDSRITMYTIDPTMLTSTVANTTDADSLPGLGDSMDAVAPDPFERSASFTGLAKTSGGKAFYSRNDVDREIEESVRDGTNYYTISYRPTNNSDVGKPYRKIRVTFTIPGLHAGYPDGYYKQETAAPTVAGTRMTYDLDAAEENTLVYTGLHVIAAPKPELQGTYLVGLSEGDLIWSPENGSESSKVVLVAAALDGKGHVLCRNSMDLTLHRPTAADVQISKTALARLEISLPAAVGAYRLRFVVRSLANGRMGTADLPIPGATPAPRPRR